MRGNSVKRRIGRIGRLNISFLRWLTPALTSWNFFMSSFWKSEQRKAQDQKPFRT